MDHVRERSPAIADLRSTAAAVAEADAAIPASVLRY
jgi:hypothetical protein